MALYYPYLVASLPMLHFGEKAPFSLSDFVAKCEIFLPEEIAAALRLLSISGQYSTKSSNAVVIKWQAFDTAIRNELVRIRAMRKKIDASKYLRPDGHGNPSMAHIALVAQRSHSLLDAEKTLDLERWHFLDELSFGHYFDADALFIYALKLLILEKWHIINSTNGAEKLEHTLKGIQHDA